MACISNLSNFKKYEDNCMMPVIYLFHLSCRYEGSKLFQKENKTKNTTPPSKKKNQQQIDDPD